LKGAPLAAGDVILKITEIGFEEMVALYNIFLFILSKEEFIISIIN